MSASEAKSVKPVREIDPAALRAFSRKFPGATLTEFAIWRHSDPTENIFRFEGETATLLGLGLIEERMVPPRPKRKAYSERGEKENWHVYRSRGERIHVSRRVSNSADPAHPLALFGPENYPFVENAQEAREEYRRDLAHVAAHASDFARGVMRGYFKGKAGRWGLCVAKEDQARMDAIAAEFEVAMRRAAQEARIVSEQPAKLRLASTDGKVLPP